MTKTLRYRILFTMMLLLSLTFVSIILAINIWSRTKNSSTAESTLRFILQREFKPDIPETENQPDTEDPGSANADDRSNDQPSPQPDDANAPQPDDHHMEIVSSHYIMVRYDADGSLISIRNTLSDSYSDEEIQSYCSEILDAGKELGTLNHLRYVTEQSDAGSVIAFIDYSSEEQSNRQLLLISVILGVVGLIILGFLSYVLSGLMVQPVDEAFLKQKQFISDASHELKTPITVILSNSELLADQYGKNRQITYIQQECDRMHHLVTSLLTLTRLEQTAEQVEKTSFCISDALLERILPMESIAYEKGIAMETDIVPDISFYGIKEQIQQLAGILIDNALTYTPEHGTITVSLRKESHRVLFAVCNTGEPIPEAERNRLFERFYRSDKARSRASGHFGLGLSIAQSIAENHKGHIRIECSEGVNSFITEFRRA